MFTDISCPLRTLNIGLWSLSAEDTMNRYDGRLGARIQWLMASEVADTNTRGKMTAEDSSRDCDNPATVKKNHITGH